MLTDNSLGFRYGYTVADTNKTSPGNGDAYNKLTRQAAETGLNDTQTVQHSDGTSTKGGNPNQSQSKYNADGSLKADDNRLKKTADGKKVSGDEYYKNLFGTEKTDSKSLNNLDPKAEQKKEHARGKHDGFDGDCPLCECETCRNRRYKDDSDDSGVSFQQATKMNPTQAKHKVKSHEMEHVRREQYKAKQDGKRVISQSVQIMTDICPECGTTYVSGGLTRTTTKQVMPEYIDLFRVGAEDITRKGEAFTQSA